MPKKEKTRTNKKYSPEFKATVVKDLLSNQLSYSYTVKKYGLMYGNSDGGARLMIQRWKRIYLEEGAEGFLKERRGRTSTDSPKKGRPPKLDKQVEEDLIAENQRLRMENEYLKKLSALVLADEQKNSKKR